jgi:hypothetical protein
MRRNVWYNMAVTYFEAEFWNCLNRLSTTRVTSIRTIGVLTYIQIHHLPDIRQMQQLLFDKIGSNFLINCEFWNESCNSGLGRTQILLPLPKLVTQVLTVINYTSVYKFHIKYHLIY